MKNLWFTTIISISFSISGIAQESLSKNDKSQESANLTVTIYSEMIKYHFDTLKDFEENSTTILDNITADVEKNKNENCDVLVEFSLTINKNGIATTILGAITTDYKQITFEAKKLKERLIEVLN